MNRHLRDVRLLGRHTPDSRGSERTIAFFRGARKPRTSSALLPACCPGKAFQRDRLPKRQLNAKDLFQLGLNGDSGALMGGRSPAAGAPLRPLAAADALLDVVDARHHLGDRVDRIMGPRLGHAAISAGALLLLLGLGELLPP